MASEQRKLDRSTPNPDLARPLTWGATPVSALVGGARRLEAEAYLSDGFGRRVAIQARPTGWCRLGTVATVKQPGRLKGVLVAPGHGLPFLAAGQAFETRPTTRKWLSSEKIPDAEERFVSPGVILVTRSGIVGRVVIAHRPHEGYLLTDDLLRVVPYSQKLAGWLYAYMRTDTFRSIMTGAHYGHVIKHIEVGQLESMPVVSVAPKVQAEFERTIQAVYQMRNRAFDLVMEAERLYAVLLGADLSRVSLDEPHRVKASDLFGGRRRLDAMHYNGIVQAIVQAQRAATHRVDLLRDITDRIWWPNRFSRVFGDNGTPYFSAEDLFDINRTSKKRVYAGLVENRADYFLHADWIVMARSGQIYGLNGSVRLVGQRLTRFLISDDLIRIAPAAKGVRSGYLLCALGHPLLGRPLVIRHAYGTSIPHLEPGDIGQIPIPRFRADREDLIADRMEEAAALRAEADEQEDAATERAEDVIASFIRGLASAG